MEEITLWIVTLAIISVAILLGYLGYLLSPNKNEEKPKEPPIMDMSWYEVRSILNKLANDYTVYPEETRAIDKALGLVQERINYEERVQAMKENP